jgi:hypothetical protein
VDESERDAANAVLEGGDQRWRASIPRTAVGPPWDPIRQIGAVFAFATPVIPAQRHRHRQAYLAASIRSVTTVLEGFVRSLQSNSSGLVETYASGPKSDDNEDGDCGPNPTIRQALPCFWEAGGAGNLAASRTIYTATANGTGLFHTSISRRAWLTAGDTATRDKIVNLSAVC